MSQFPKEVTVNIYECEHDGDLNRYVDELTEAGAKVLSSELNESGESCTLRLRVETVEIALKVQATNAWGFR